MRPKFNIIDNLIKKFFVAYLKKLSTEFKRIIIVDIKLLMISYIKYTKAMIYLTLQS